MEKLASSPSLIEQEMGCKSQNSTISFLLCLPLNFLDTDFKRVKITFARPVSALAQEAGFSVCDDFFFCSDLAMKALTFCLEISCFVGFSCC